MSYYFLIFKTMMDLLLTRHDKVNNCSIDWITCFIKQQICINISLQNMENSTAHLNKWLWCI